MKKFLSMALCFVFALTMCTVAFAEDAEIAKGTPVIDGEIESVWESANEYDMGLVLEADHFIPIEGGDADLSGTWKALWDDENFYLLVEVADEARVDDSDAGNMDDAVELLIASSGPESTLSTYRWIVGESKAFESYSGPPEWADLDDAQVTTAINDTGDGYVLEAAIAWENLYDNEGGVAEGQTIHLDVHAVDDDSDSNADEDGENPADHSIAWIGPIDNTATGSGHMGTAVLAAGEGSSSADAPSAMPNTGMGGTANVHTAWMLIVVSAAAVVGGRMVKVRMNK